MSRALVLGGGGTTGIAWECGVLDALDAGGVDVAAADRVIGTSAGAIVGAFLGLGVRPAELATTWLDHVKTIGHLHAVVVARLAVGQLGRDRETTLRRYGGGGVVTSGLSEDAFVQAISEHLIGRSWPAGLQVTTVNAMTARPAIFDASSGVDLGLAVAASCAVPGVFPPVHIGGDPHLDGGARTPVNIDLAAGCDRVIALAPFHLARDPGRRPTTQLAGLPSSTRWLYVRPDATATRVIGLDALDAARRHQARDAGRRQGRSALNAARRAWGASAI
jgi:NTE family protein